MARGRRGVGIGAAVLALHIGTAAMGAPRGKPAPTGAWVEMGQHPNGVSLGWGDPESDVDFYHFWMVCRPKTKSIRLSIQIDGGRVGSRARVRLSKGGRNLFVEGPVEADRGSAMVQASFPQAEVLAFLDRPGELVIGFPAGPMRFRETTYAAARRSFAADCARGAKKAEAVTPDLGRKAEALPMSFSS